MSQVESRPLRHFLAVARALNFTRAAEELSISAPALSRTIAQLEAQLDVKLFERSTHRVELTTAGRVLQEQGELAIDALDAAAHLARRAAEPAQRLVVAVKPDLDGGLLEQAIASYATEQPAVTVEVLLCGWGEQLSLLREGRADVALVFQPHERLDGRHTDFEVLQAETPLAALHAGHPLASRTTLALTDLEPDYQHASGTVLWWRRREHVPASVGDMSQLLALVERGELIALLPGSVAARFSRPGIEYRPVPDAPPATLAVAWPRSSRSLATAAFVRVLTDLAADRNREAPAAGSRRGRSGPLLVLDGVPHVEP
jgi:DNA-binding transcriptional LysR family regulator